MECKYTGIIMNKREVGETDRIYTIYTFEAGKIKILAKGIRKTNAKLAGYLEPITLAEIFLAKTKGMGKITGSIVTDNFLGIKSDVDSLKQVFCVFKILEKTVSEQNQDEKIASLLKEYLKTMEDLSIEKNKKNMNKKSILTLGFLFKFLSDLGYQIEANRCVKCGKKLVSENNFFSAQSGGVLCYDCALQEAQKIKINDESVKLIRIFLKNKLPSLIKIDTTEKDVHQIKLIFSDFLGWVFGESCIVKKGLLW